MNVLMQGFMFLFSVAFTKEDGSPGIVEGSPLWELTDPSLGTLNVDPDGMSATVAWAGVGQCDVICRADGDLGEGVFPIVMSQTIQFKEPLGAVAGTMTVSEPIPVE